MATYVVCDEHGRLQGWRRTCPMCGPPPNRRVIAPEQHPIVVERVRNGESLAEVAESYGVTRQRIHQIATQLDPQATALGAAVRRTQRRERQEAAAQARAAALGPCRVCLGPIQLRRGRVTTTCSDRCAELWRLARLHLDPRQYETHRRAVAHVALARPDHYGPAKVAWAKRYLAGETPPNRRYVSTSGKVAAALRQIEALRREQQSAPEAVAG